MDLGGAVRFVGEGRNAHRKAGLLELDRPYGRLTGLVVDEGWRGQGIGRLLLETVEGWLKERGASLLLITSGLHRVEAHEFYRHLGYKQTGLRFAKKV